MTEHIDIPIARPRYGASAEERVLEVLRSGRTAQGPMVERLEELGALMAGTTHAVAVANGSLALEAALEVLGIGPGDEVITSPLTFGATLNSILRSGATARFADVRVDMTIDPASVSALIGPRTAALLPVHLYGLPADMPALMGLASTHGLAVIEDAAQAHGAAVQGTPAGGFGLGSFSFYATKNVSAGEGGLLTTSDAELARSLRVLRNQGMERRYEYIAIGRNLRLGEIPAALAIPQLERLAESRAEREGNAQKLSALLDDARVTLPEVPPGRRHAWHVFTILLESAEREDLVRKVRAGGVGAEVYYPRLVWDHAVYRSHDRVTRDHTPHAAEVVRYCVSLPIYDGLERPELERIARTVLSALG